MCTGVHQEPHCSTLGPAPASQPKCQAHNQHSGMAKASKTTLENPRELDSHQRPHLEGQRRSVLAGESETRKSKMGCWLDPEDEHTSFGRTETSSRASNQTHPDHLHQLGQRIYKQLVNFIIMVLCRAKKALTWMPLQLKEKSEL